MSNNGDVIGIGSPLLDVIVEVDEEMLGARGLRKGGMHLVSGAQSRDILDGIDHLEKRFVSGGSAANTLAGVSMLGSKGAFTGMIGDDEYGDMYENDTLRHGVDAQLHRHGEERTGHAITFITPDGQRTFATHLGAAQRFHRRHIEPRNIGSYKVLHVEGYQLEDEQTREAVWHAMRHAKKAGTRISIDLSDPGLIDRCRVEAERAVRDFADIVFANEDEAFAFTGKEEREALHAIGKMCDIAIVKLGERGSVICAHGDVLEIAPRETKVVNTNGAGDAYAAGFLHGFVRGYALDRSGDLASHFASLACASPGARVDEGLRDKIIR